ncbi:MAG: UDP-glucose--hexose-1-phosphate uridylyltransferase [bacterium]
METIFSNPHSRLNPLTGEWLLVSPHRLKRPWQGKVEQTPPETRPTYDPKCYLCPGNERAGGARNPDYQGTFVFENDFAALLPDAPASQADANPLFAARRERGTCRVICFSPDHSLTLAQMSEDAIACVIDAWMEQFRELGALEHIRNVQIFENKGAIMGCSNPHPHGQIWATENIPTEPAKEDESQRRYFETHDGRALLDDYQDEELRRAERVVCRNDAWAALVPFWAKWPYETMLLPARPLADMNDFGPGDKTGLANILKRLTTRYDNLFRVSFPYTMGFHQAPVGGCAHPHWRIHAHFYPPLLRSAAIQKFMVGFEMLAMPQRDITPELAAETLRSLSEDHF